MLLKNYLKCEHCQQNRHTHKHTQNMLCCLKEWNHRRDKIREKPCLAVPFTVDQNYFKAKKTYYAVLGDRALELYDSEKTQKKKKHARFLIDLSTCFNINKHFDGRLKYCVAVMTPDETLFLKGENDASTDEWYCVLISALIPARALHLGRPVLANEFFECAWDVIVAEQPKLKKSQHHGDLMVNICKKSASLAGPCRLCFYPHTIFICQRGIEPASIHDLSESRIPPFKSTDVVEFPRKYVSSFGSQGKCFVMTLGRSSPWGSCELWAHCESEQVAADIHDKLNMIIEREREKKKQIVEGPLIRFYATNPYRDRSHTHSGSQRIIVRPMKKTSLAVMQRTEHHVPNSVDDKEIVRQPSTPCVPSSVSFDSVLTSDRPIVQQRAKKPYRTRSVEDKKRLPNTSWRGEERQPVSEDFSLESLHRLGISRHRSSFASSSAAEETEDSGGTLRLADVDEERNRQKTDMDRQIAAQIERMLPPDLKEAFMAKSAFRKESSALSQMSPDNCEHEDNASSSAAGSSMTNDEFLQTTPGDMSEDTSGDHLDYAPMDLNSWSSGSASYLGISASEPQYNLEEIRSYVSDSSDSCYSSIAPNRRAHSFGASHITQQRPRPTMKKQPFDHGSPAPDTCEAIQRTEVSHQLKASNSQHASQGDPRKRAFSLGSKSWFAKPLRKLSRDFALRAHRHSTASGASSASSFGPSTHHSTNPSYLSTPQAFVAPDPPLSRVRSESIGSWRSILRTKCVPEDSDHIPLDFRVITNHSGSVSGSAHSMESPIRSRTSSFGCGQRCYTVRDPGEVVIHVVDTDHDTIALPATRRTPLLHEKCLDIDEEGSISSSACAEVEEHDDYVVSDPAENSFSEYYLHTGPACSSYDSSQLATSNYPDSRNSQVFETIQESLSGRSSPASFKDARSSESQEGNGVDVNEKQDQASFSGRSLEPCSGEISHVASNCNDTR